MLLGAPGSGKGTQGTVLAQVLAVPHVSSGDLLRHHVAEGTELGRDVAGYVNRGDLVPDDLVLAVVGDAVVKAMETGGYVLDGFPRTIQQAEQAYALAGPAGVAAQAVVFLVVPDDVVRQRLSARAVEGRPDDADPGIIEHRLELFHTETDPLLDFYRDRGILVPVDADQPPDAVTDDILSRLGEIRARGG